MSTTRRRWRPRRPRRAFPARASAPETRGRHATRTSSERVVSVDDRQGGILISFLPRAESQGWVSLRLRGGCPSRRCVASVAGGRTPRANGSTPHWRKRKWAHAGARGMADCPGNRQLGLCQFRSLATRDLSPSWQAGQGWLFFSRKRRPRWTGKYVRVVYSFQGWLVRRLSSGLSQTFIGSETERSYHSVITRKSYLRNVD